MSFKIGFTAVIEKSRKECYNIYYRTVVEV